MSYWVFEVDGWGKIMQSGADVLVIRDQLVGLLRTSEWYAAQEDGETSELAYRVGDLAQAEDLSQIDAALWEIYNVADDQRAWLDPSP